MQSRTSTHLQPLPRTLSVAIIAVTLWSLPGRTDAQLNVGVYDATTGAPIQTSLISGAGSSIPSGFAVSGNNLFIGNYDFHTGTSSVDMYNATTGAVINSNFINGLNVVRGIVVAGNNLFVGSVGPAYDGPNVNPNALTVTVGEYNATTGMPIQVSLTHWVSNTSSFSLALAAMTVSGDDLFVATLLNDFTVSEYDVATGAPINANFLVRNSNTGLDFPDGLAVSGNSLFVANFDAVSEYDATNGSTINSSFVSPPSRVNALAVEGNSLFVTYGNGLSGGGGDYDAATGTLLAQFDTGRLPNQLAVTENGVFVTDSPTPEPGGATLLVLGSGVLLGRRQRRAGS